MRKRTRARELALQILYQIDLRGPDTVMDLDDMLASSELSEEGRSFAGDLVRGTISSKGDADRLITEAAEHWDIARMAVIDRNILRLAVHEMLERDDIPKKVSINEAIDMGKKFSTGNSGAFINGILDRIRRIIEE